MLGGKYPGMENNLEVDIQTLSGDNIEKVENNQFEYMKSIFC